MRIMTYLNFKIVQKQANLGSCYQQQQQLKFVKRRIRSNSIFKTEDLTNNMKLVGANFDHLEENKT